MHETFLGDLAWLWGTTMTRHVIFIVVVAMTWGAIRSGWLEADNTIRLNRKLRREERDQSFK